MPNSITLIKKNADWNYLEHFMTLCQDELDSLICTFENQALATKELEIALSKNGETLSVIIQKFLETAQNSNFLNNLISDMDIELKFLECEVEQIERYPKRAIDKIRYSMYNPFLSHYTKLNQLSVEVNEFNKTASEFFQENTKKCPIVQIISYHIDILIYLDKQINKANNMTEEISKMLNKSAAIHT